MQDRDALTQAWLQAERIAVAAELELASHGQAQATPELRDKVLRTTQLRREADALFDQLHSHLKSAPGADPAR